MRPSMDFRFGSKRFRRVPRLDAKTSPPPPVSSASVNSVSTFAGFGSVIRFMGAPAK